MRPFWISAAVLALVALGIAWHFWPYQAGQRLTASLVPQRFSRPYGMAPAAFAALVRACNNARVQPWRIGQTIGNHPLSVGYHRPDGVMKFRGESLPYNAAVDLGTSDLTRPQLTRFFMRSRCRVLRRSIAKAANGAGTSTSTRFTARSR